MSEVQEVEQECSTGSGAWLQYRKWSMVAVQEVINTVHTYPWCSSKVEHVIQKRFFINSFGRFL